MTICHKPDEESGYTDEQLVEHLKSSECSECVQAGYRLAQLIARENGENTL